MIGKIKTYKLKIAQIENQCDITEEAIKAYTKKTFIKECEETGIGETFCIALGNDRIFSLRSHRNEGSEFSHIEKKSNLIEYDGCLTILRTKEST